MKPSEILRGAAQRVNQGWCRGTLRDKHNNVCSIGALKDTLQAEGLDPLAAPYEYWRAAEALAKAFREQFPDYAPGLLRLDAETQIWRYNDYAVPDKDAVIACMEKAANNLEA